MGKDNKLENSKKRLKIYYSLLISVICFIGVSFAFFTLYLRQGDNNAVTALSCFTTTLTEENSAINLTNEFPISDENGMKKTPFTFKLTNTCDKYVKAYITLDSLKEGEANYILSKYIKANVSSKGTTDSGSLIVGNQPTKELENKDNGYILKEVVLKPKESKEYDLRIWIDYDTTKEQAAGMTYPSQIVIVTEPSKTSLAGAILADNEVVEPLTVPGKEVSAHTLNDVESETASVSSTYRSYYITYGTGWKVNGTNGTKFDLTGATVTSNTYANSYSSLVGKYLASNSLSSAGSSTAGTVKTTTYLNSIYYIVSATASSFIYKEITSNKNTTEALLASTEDDYGTSYYFRGNVKNNYVEFANKCWRIVRITGDGSTKLVLYNDNTGGLSSPCSSTNNNATAAFARYSGTTYSSTFNSKSNDNTYIGFMYGKVGTSDYTSVHENINKSTILTNLETWYQNNLMPYTNELADIIWCNDKSTVNITILGHAMTYAAYDRIHESKMPTLMCSIDNNGGKLSKLTANDTVNGNGDLTYKIGLLTADEVAFAGSVFYYKNNATYLHKNAETTWWSTISPSYSGSIFVVGAGSLNINGVGNENAIRPAIALKASTTVSGGSGTSEDPYIVD